MNTTVPSDSDFIEYREPHSAFQKLIDSARKRCGLSECELAEKVGVPPATLWIWLHNIKAFNGVLNIAKSLYCAAKVTLLVLTAATLITSASLADDLQTLVTTNGHRYEKARITEVTPISIKILHSAGVSRVPLTKFPPDVQRRFGYVEAKARAWLAEQARVEEAKKQQVAKDDAAKRKEAQQARRDVETISHYLDDGGHLQYDPVSKQLYDPNVEAARRREAFKFYQRYGYWPVLP